MINTFEFSKTYEWKNEVRRKNNKGKNIRKNNFFYSKILNTEN